MRGAAHTVLIVLSVAGCTSGPPLGRPANTLPGGAESPVVLPRSASSTLLEQSRAARADRDYAAAATAIERALRIEPNDAQLWLEYGYVQFARGDYEQALTLGRKTLSLAGDQRAIHDAASRLVTDANRERSRAASAAQREAELH